MDFTADNLPGRKLARKIIEDIESKGLRPGDEYLTAEQAGEKLGVSRATADRAMQLLTSRRFLVRQRGQGTFVGPSFRKSVNSPDGKTPQKFIQMLFELPPVQQTGVSLEYLLRSVSQLMPEHVVQLTGLNDESAVETIVKQLEVNRNADLLGGVILGGGEYKLHRYLLELGIPTVIWGSSNYSGENFVSIDRDAFDAGRLMVSHLLDKGFEHISLLLILRNRIGTHRVYDGIVSELARRKLPPDTLSQWILPNSEEEIEGEIDEWLSQVKKPCGVICNGMVLGEHITSAAKSLGVRIPQELEVVFTDSLLADLSRTDLPHVSPLLSKEQAIERSVEILKKLQSGERIEEHELLVPVELVIPR